MQVIDTHNFEKVFIDGKIDTETAIKINEYLESLNNKLIRSTEKKPEKTIVY